MPYRLDRYNIDQHTVAYQQIVEYYDYCVYERNFTDASMRGKISSINHFLAHTKISDVREITNEMMAAYIRTQTEQGLMPRTINNRTKHVKAMVNYFKDIKDYEFPNLKMRRIVKQHEEPADKRAFSRDIIYEVLRYADREAWLMIKICFDCGLRISELRKMRLKDINGNKLLIHGKGRKNRLAILSNEVQVRLEDWIKREGITNWVWPSLECPGYPLADCTVRKMIKRPFAAAGIPDAKPHELRCSYATDLKKLGAATRYIQQGLGHTSEKITEIYLKDLDSSTLDELYRIKYSAAAPELR